MTRCAGLGLAVAVAGAVQIASAGTPKATPAAIEVDREVPPPGRTELGFDGGAPVEGWGATITFGWLERPITLRTADTESQPVARRETLALGGALALGDAVVVDARLPLAHQTGDRLAILGEPRALDRWVPGDLRLGARVRVAGTAERAAFIRAELSLPTGDDRDFAGESSWSLAWSLIGRLTLPHGILLASAAGIRLRGDEVLIGDRLVGDELHGSAGLAIPISPVRPLWWAAEQVKLTGEIAAILGDNVAGKRGPSPAEARVGVVTKPTSAITLGARLGFGLGDEIGAPRWRATFELTYQGTARLIPRATSPEDAREADDHDEP
jgi:hypothetical protein